MMIDSLARQCNIINQVHCLHMSTIALSFLWRIPHTGVELRFWPRQGEEKGVQARILTKARKRVT